MAGEYVAEIVEVPGEGIRLQPSRGASIPDQPNEIDLLGLAIALALGSAAYEHHPEPRNPQAQTIEALLAGEATMPWRPEPAPDDGDDATASQQAANRQTGSQHPTRPAGTVPYIVCKRSDAGVSRCEVQYRPPARS